MKIALLEAKCGACGFEFAHPQLSDFSYGQFVFTGELGTVYAFIEVPNPVWMMLDSALKSTNSRKDQGALLQAAAAHFADPIDGQRLLRRPVCPKCQSSELASWSGIKQGEADIPRASYDAFVSRPIEDQKRVAQDFFARFGLG